MRYFKISIFILIFLLPGAVINGQAMKKIKTSELTGIADRYGIDSVMGILINGMLDLYVIDSTAAISLVNYFDEYPSSSGRAMSIRREFINRTSLNIKSKTLKKKIYGFFENELRKVMSTKPDNKGMLQKIDDHLIKIVEKQNPDNVECLINNHYLKWKRISDSIRSIMSYDELHYRDSVTTWPLPICVSFECANNNCYKLMYLMKQMKSEFYDEKAYEYYILMNSFIRSQLREIYYDYHEQEKEIVSLSRRHKSLGDIDLSVTPFICTSIEQYKNEKEIFLYNNKIGFLALSTDNSKYPEANLGGSGIVYKLELINNKKLIIRVIFNWDS